MRSFLTETLLGSDEVFVHNVVDVGVVRVKELLHLVHLRVVQEEAQMLQHKIYVKIYTGHEAGSFTNLTKRDNGGSNCSATPGSSTKSRVRELSP
jgi:hypothetical protein